MLRVIHNNLDKANEYIKEIEEKDKKSGNYLSKGDKERIGDLKKSLIKDSRKAIEIKEKHEEHALDKKTIQDFKKKSELPQEAFNMFMDKKKH